MQLVTVIIIITITVDGTYAAGDGNNNNSHCYINMTFYFPSRSQQFQIKTLSQQPTVRTAILQQTTCNSSCDEQESLQNTDVQKVRQLQQCRHIAVPQATDALCDASTLSYRRRKP